MERKQVYRIIDEERQYQDQKWGDIQLRPKQVGSYLTLMRHLLTKAENSWAGSSSDIQAMHEIRQLVAVGVACMEQHEAIPRSQNIIS